MNKKILLLAVLVCSGCTDAVNARIDRNNEVIAMKYALIDKRFEMLEARLPAVTPTPAGTPAMVVKK